MRPEKLDFCAPLFSWVLGISVAGISRVVAIRSLVFCVLLIWWQQVGAGDGSDDTDEPRRFQSIKPALRPKEGGQLAHFRGTAHLTGG